jgi:hypothetical protein
LCVTTSVLELVNQTQSDDIVSADTSLFGEVVFIQQVDFVINIGGHIFVEVVSRANINIFQQILIAEVGGVVADVLTFGLQVSNGWTQTEVELVLSNHFEVLRFVSKTEGICCAAAVRGAKTGCVVGLGVLRCQIDVVCVIFQAAAVDVSTIAVTVYTCCVLVGGTFRRCQSSTRTEASPQIVGQGCAVTVAVLFQQAATASSVILAAYAAVSSLILQSKVQAFNQTEEVLVTVGCNAVSTRLQEVI